MTHHPSELIVPSTSLQVFDSAMKCMQFAHFCVPLGWGWYRTLTCETFVVSAGAADTLSGTGLVGPDDARSVAGGRLPLPAEPVGFWESQPSNVAGASRPNPAASAPRSTILRGRTSASAGCAKGEFTVLPDGFRMAAMVFLFMSISFARSVADAPRAEGRFRIGHAPRFDNRPFACVDSAATRAFGLYDRLGGSRRFGRDRWRQSVAVHVCAIRGALCAPGCPTLQLGMGAGVTVGVQMRIGSTASLDIAGRSSLGACADHSGHDCG